MIIVYYINGRRAGRSIYRRKRNIKSSFKWNFFQIFIFLFLLNVYAGTYVVHGCDIFVDFITDPVPCLYKSLLVVFVKFIESNVIRYGAVPPFRNHECILGTSQTRYLINSKSSKEVQ